MKRLASSSAGWHNPLAHGRLRLGPVTLHGNAIWVLIVVVAVLVLWQVVAIWSRPAAQRRRKIGRRVKRRFR